MSTSPTEITEFFQKNGYYHAKGVYSPAEVAELETDFDRIVRQLNASGEEVAVRWKGASIDKIDSTNTVALRMGEEGAPHGAIVPSCPGRHYMLKRNSTTLRFSS